MNEDAQAAADAADIQPPESIENFDFSQEDGGLGADQEADSDEELNEIDDDESDQQDEADNDQDDEGDDTDADENQDGEEIDTSKMSDAERNKYFYEQRVQKREAAKKQEGEFLTGLRAQVKESYIDVDPNEEDYEMMEPEVANALRDLRKAQREAEADKKFQELQSVRDNTANSILQAENSIPLFNEADKQHYNKAAHQKALSDWASIALDVVLSEDGQSAQVVGLKPGAPSAYEYLQESAKFVNSLLKTSSAKAQRAAQRNRANSESVSSSQTRTSSDSFEALEDRVGNIPLA